MVVDAGPLLNKLGHVQAGSEVCAAIREKGRQRRTSAFEEQEGKLCPDSSASCPQVAPQDSLFALDALLNA